jgi:hypothetical protein
MKIIDKTNSNEETSERNLRWAKQSDFHVSNIVLKIPKRMKNEKYF